MTSHQHQGSQELAVEAQESSQVPGLPGEANTEDKRIEEEIRAYLTKQRDVAIITKIAFWLGFSVFLGLLPIVFGVTVGFFLKGGPNLISLLANGDILIGSVAVGGSAIGELVQRNRKSEVPNDGSNYAKWKTLGSRDDLKSYTTQSLNGKLAHRFKRGLRQPFDHGAGQ